MQMIIYKNIGLNLAIEVDLGKKILYAYDLEEGEVVQKSRGVLQSLASDIADDLQNKLEISLEKFDVEVINENPIEMQIW